MDENFQEIINPSSTTNFSSGESNSRPPRRNLALYILATFFILSGLIGFFFVAVNFINALIDSGLLIGRTPVSGLGPDLGQLGAPLLTTLLSLIVGFVMLRKKKILLVAPVLLVVWAFFDLLTLFAPSVYIAIPILFTWSEVVSYEAVRAFIGIPLLIFGLQGAYLASFMRILFHVIILGIVITEMIRFKKSISSQ